MVLAAATSALAPLTTQPHYHTTTSQHGRWIPFHHSHAQRKLAPSAVAQLSSQHKEGREALQTHTPYKPDRFNFVRSIIQKSMGATLAVLVGSVISPAAFAKLSGVRQKHTLCPMCSEPMADLDHIYWKCPQRLTTTSPKDRLQSRFGWPLNGADLATLRQLSDTVELLWKDRHSDRDYGPRQYVAKGFSCDWHPTRQQRNIAK